MAKSINKFIVRLSDQSSFRPQLAVAVVPIKEQKKTFEVRLLNPNTKEVVYKEEFKSKAKDEMACFLDALNHGKSLLEKPEIKIIQYSIEYKEQIFIPQGRRGKMKLKTKDSEEAIAERAAEETVVKDTDLDVSEDIPEMEEMDLDQVENESVIEEEVEKPKKSKKKELKKVTKKVKNKVKPKKVVSKTKNKKKVKVKAKNKKVVSKNKKKKK